MNKIDKAKAWIIDYLKEHPEGITRKIFQNYGLARSRDTFNKRMNELIKSGIVKKGHKIGREQYYCLTQNTTYDQITKDSFFKYVILHTIAGYPKGIENNTILSILTQSEQSNIIRPLADELDKHVMEADMSDTLAVTINKHKLDTLIKELLDSNLISAIEKENDNGRKIMIYKCTHPLFTYDQLIEYYSYYLNNPTEKLADDFLPKQYIISGIFLGIASNPVNYDIFSPSPSVKEMKCTSVPVQIEFKYKGTAKRLKKSILERLQKVSTSKLTKSENDTENTVLVNCKLILNDDSLRILRSFGSTCTIKGPTSLIESMIKSLNLAINSYSTTEFDDKLEVPHYTESNSHNVKPIEYYEIYNDVFLRISIYLHELTFRSSDGYIIGTSIKKISDKHKIPIEAVRKDIYALMNVYSKIHSHNDSQFIKFKTACYNNNTDEIISGRFDDELLYSDIHGFDYYYISKDKESLNELRRKIAKIHSHRSDNTLSIILMAISSHKQVLIKTKYKGYGYHVVTPVKLYYNDLTSSYKLIYYDGSLKSIYVDDLLSIDVDEWTRKYTDYNSENDTHRFILKDKRVCIQKNETDFDQGELSKYTPHVWGAEYGSKKYHVKVKFHKSVREKVLEEFAHTDTSKTISDVIGDSFYFEDDIYGIDYFRRVLRSFFPYAILLEPEDISKEMLNKLKETLNNYQ